MKINLEYEQLKTKVLKYVLYKKRTEKEVKQKFLNEDIELLEEVIEYLKQEKYIDDNNYIERSVNEYIALKNLSIKELVFKLSSKGVSKKLIDNYIYENKEKMLEYELKSANNIVIKKSRIMEKEEIEQYLLKKGYTNDIIKYVLKENT